MNNAPQKNTIKPPIGVFAALRGGLDLIATKYWLILLPLLLDFALWLGPRFSVKPVLEEPYEQYMAAFGSAMQDMNAEEPIIEPTESLFLDHYFLLLGMPPFLGMPSIISNPNLPREVLSLPFPVSPSTIQIHTPAGLFLGFTTSIVGNILLFTLFSILIADAVKQPEQSKSMSEWLRYIVLTFLQFLAAIIVIPIGMFLLLFPFLIPSMVLTFAGIAGTNIVTIIASLIALIGWLLIFWLGTFIVFTGHGVTLNRKNIIMALWDSVRVVQWNTSATLFMLLTVIFLHVLLRLLWFSAPTDSFATIIAIIGNAFASTALLAATYIFFQERYRFWQEMRSHLKEQLLQKRAEKQA